MRHLILVLLALSAPLFAVQEDEGPEPPSKELVASTVDALQTAYKSKEATRMAEAIEAAREVLHADVIKLVAKALKDKAVEVQNAAIDALRWMDHPDALKALVGHWKKSKELRRDPERAPTLLKAIGQHASPSSIKLLADNVFENPARKVVQARILGLGRVRDAKAVDTLIDLLAKQGAGRGGRGGGNTGAMNDFRTALTVLTGRDLGRDQNAWRRWWNDNEKGFKVSAELPKLPRDIEGIWKRYWGLENDTRRNDQREDRGGGPEGR